MDYIAIIHKEGKSDFGVSFPDFPGCVTAGKTLDEAKDNAVEALQFHIEGIMEDGDNIPVPSSLDSVMADKNSRDGVAFIVPYQGQAKTVRVNITMTSLELAAIDSAAKQVGKARSTFLVDAALHR